MRETLFRKEATARSSASIWGGVILTQPLGLSLVTVFAMCTCSALGALLVWGHYARQVTVRGVLSLGRTSESDVSLVPASAGLHAELYVPTRAFGSLGPGQQVWLHYDAFPSPRFGSFRGRVREVSEVILLPRDPQLPIVIEESVHRVTVELVEHELVVHGRQVPLRAGMRLSTQITVERRSLIGWLLGPLINVRPRETGGRNA